LIKFTIQKKLEGGLGRAGELETPHGKILTPAFVVVGTKATMKGVTPEQLKETGAQVALSNTYHLFLQPGDDVIKGAGGLGKFMNWNGPTMTDSGGFQVFSLGAAYGKEISKVIQTTDPSLLIPERSTAEDGVARLATVGNDGVSFRSHINGDLHYITPEKSIQIQHNIGADIIFAFDECTSPAETYEYQKESLERTHSWARRSLAEHKKLLEEAEASVSAGISATASLDSNIQGRERMPEDTAPKPNGSPAKHTPPAALFGIVQGGRHEDLRKESARVIGSMDFDGFGIGGSFAKEDMSTAVKWVNEILPEEKPRHLLGIGEPGDLFMGVENGVDLFDCVTPTRHGRNGSIYTKDGRLLIMNTQYRTDYTPIESDCGCYACKNYTRAYIAHLFHAKEMLAGILCSIHNIYFLVHLVDNMRQAILDGTFLEMKEGFLKRYYKN
jgi:queuine tRNA-ribosyltransferase